MPFLGENHAATHEGGLEDPIAPGDSEVCHFELRSVRDQAKRINKRPTGLVDHYKHHPPTLGARILRMRYAIDSAVALRLIDEGITSPHQLVAPQALRSAALSTLYRAVRSGDLTAAQGRTLLEGLAAQKIRLLGDRVSRAHAWRIAADLNWEDTALAEYLAVAHLQADALVTEDPVLASAAVGIVPLASWEDLL